MSWFKNPGTLEELKKQYKQLAMEHHPDMGGNKSDMKAINAEYDTLFAKLKNVHKNAAREMYKSKTETKGTANDFKDIINELLKLKEIKIKICCSVDLD